MAHDALHFLPRLRLGIGALTGPPDGAGRPRIDAAVELVAHRRGGAEPVATASRPVPLAGPEDVRGLGADAITRVWPPAGAGEAEPNLLPLVEFAAPDLPWRYSPEPVVDGRLRPWLVLLVVSEAEVQGEPSPLGGGFSGQRVMIRGGTPLPDPTQAWAFAHVQSPTLPGANVAEWLAAERHRLVARLLCPRRLAPDTTWRALVVPTYRRGQQAALGRAVDGGTAELAWTGWQAPPDGLELAAYHTWRFATGPAQDFEDLARRLSPNADPSGLGRMRLEVPLGPSGERATIEIGGALAPARAAPLAAMTPAEQAAFVTGCGLDLGRAEAEAIVGPPLYGGPQTGRDALPAAHDPAWMARLNLDPRWRVAAGLGAEVVRRNQETYMAEVWRQTDAGAEPGGDWRSTADGRRRARVAHEMRRVLATRHVDPQTMPARVTALYASATDPSAEDNALTGNAPSGARSRLMRRVLRGARGMARRQHRASDALAALGGRMGHVGLPGLGGRHLAAFARPVLTPPRPMTAPVAAMAGALGRLVSPPSPPPSPAPRLDVATWRDLAAVSAEWLLPGLGALPPDSVTLLRIEPAFVEAFLAGMNHEMARELRWREHPSDGRATVFRRFFGRPATDEISPIDRWQGALGTHGLDADPPVAVVLRGALLHRYPGTGLYALPASAVVDGPGHEPATISDAEALLPIFGGTLGPDVAFVGLPGRFADGAPLASGWIVLQERPSAPRFGADLTASDGPPSTDPWDDLSWDQIPRSGPAGGHIDLDRRPDARGPWVAALERPGSAGLAAALVQRPVRVILRAEQLLAGGGGAR